VQVTRVGARTWNEMAWGAGPRGGPKGNRKRRKSVARSAGAVHARAAGLLFASSGGLKISRASSLMSLV
jgi:hypothetical protein